MHRPEETRTPVHQSVVQPLLLGGIKRELFICNATTTAAFMIGFHMWWYGLVGCGIYLLARWCTAKWGARFWEVLLRNGHYKAFYDA